MSSNESAMIQWTERFSKTYSKPYWVNMATGERSWTNPNQSSKPTNESESINKRRKEESNVSEESLPPQKKVKADDRTVEEVLPVRFTDSNEHQSSCSINGISEESRANDSDDSAPPSPPPPPPSSSVTDEKIAIIVPFRDLRKEQVRGAQLQRFVPEMVSFLKKSQYHHDFHIYIIEQSNDERKFNRGKLLNIGFDIARKENCTIFILHDVDLIPSEELISSYCTRPLNVPIHIARVWNRYSKNPNYFGGVVSFSKEMFEKINGFPNNFWGWGGEDDELFRRISDMKMEFTSPSNGHFIDMENMDLLTKLSYLRENKELKCLNKLELLEEHQSTWKKNGLSDLHYEELSRTIIENGEGYASRILVDVQLNNNHWADEVCGINDLRSFSSITGTQKV